MKFLVVFNESVKITDTYRQACVLAGKHLQLCPNVCVEIWKGNPNTEDQELIANFYNSRFAFEEATAAKD